ncbi:MAG: hypothetical protein JJ879_13040 [Sneathiella sp.]|nr:hypothetical protein [Sneathiella sp.]
MQRGLTIAIAIFLLIFCAVIVTIYVSIGSVISDSVRQRTEAITQTPVSVGEVDYSANTGLTSITSAAISNPAGFSSTQAIQFGKIELWIDPETLNTPIIHVKAITISNPEVTYEIQDQSDNLRTLRQQIEYSLRNNKPRPGDKLFYVENITFAPGTLVIHSNNLTGKRSTATLSKITLSNIGSKTEGVTAERLAYELVLPLLRETTLSALNTDLPLDDQARNLLNGALDETNKAVDMLKGILNK